MILTQILEPSYIKVPLTGTDKESVVTELVALLNDAGRLEDEALVLESVLARERTRSTGIGSGIAIPHGKCKGVKELVMSIGISPKGIDFQSVDGAAVNIVVLLVSPIDKTGPHIQALARISRLMLDAEFKENLEKATSAQQLYELIENKENE